MDVRNPKVVLLLTTHPNILAFLVDFCGRELTEMLLKATVACRGDCKRCPGPGHPTGNIIFCCPRVKGVQAQLFLQPLVLRSHSCKITVNSVTYLEMGQEGGHIKGV